MRIKKNKNSIEKKERQQDGISTHRCGTSAVRRAIRRRLRLPHLRTNARQAVLRRPHGEIEVEQIQLAQVIERLRHVDVRSRARRLQVHNHIVLVAAHPGRHTRTIVRLQEIRSHVGRRQASRRRQHTARHVGHHTVTNRAHGPGVLVHDHDRVQTGRGRRRKHDGRKRRRAARRRHALRDLRAATRHNGRAAGDGERHTHQGR